MPRTDTLPATSVPLPRVPVPGIVSWIIAGFVGIGLLTIVLGSWYTIDQTQRGILLRNGAFVEVVQPGLHFKWPWIDAVAKIDMQTHTFTWSKMES
jgi:regulator of protease activity HflC (stomatin/prohibitin superfamily)